MSTDSDDTYISDYLIHWTGRNGNEDGAYVLGLISSSLRLLLSYNTLHVFDFTHKVDDKMVCFTDVPLRHSNEHCKRYGHFGIAFHKLRLMNKGAQPVFYASHACKDDMSTIFQFLQEQNRCTTVPTKVIQALHRHFYFIQRLSDSRADRHDTFYYEREWRIGEQSLLSEEQLKRPNPKYRAMQEGYPRYTGKRDSVSGSAYFVFEREDVAFLIAPSSHCEKIDNPYGLPLKTYEDVVKGGRA